jgi:hypothetical protein
MIIEGISGRTFENIFILWPQYLPLALLGHRVCGRGSFDGNVGAIGVATSHMPKGVVHGREGVVVCSILGRYLSCAPLHIGEAWQTEVVPVVVFVAKHLIFVGFPIIVCLV